MPYGADQPDNAARAVRLGVARSIDRGQYRSIKVARELRKLFEQGTYVERARELGAVLREENGTAVACDAIEAVLRNRPAQTLATVP